MEIALSLTTAPARDLPAALWSDVLEVLEAHGLNADAPAVVDALFTLIRRTPIERGGRLRPDGSVAVD